MVGGAIDLPGQLELHQRFITPVRCEQCDSECPRFCRHPSLSRKSIFVIVSKAAGRTVPVSRCR